MRHSPLPHFPLPLIHCPVFIPFCTFPPRANSICLPIITHDVVGHYRVCKAAELSSLLAGYATRCSSPEDFSICRRKCRFHLRRRWRRNSCERRLGILRVARSISLQRIYGHSSSSRGTGASAQVALATATGPGQDNQDKCQKCLRNTKTGSARFTSVRVASVRVASMSFVSLINCISIIISCSLTSPDTVRGSVTVSVTSTSSRSHRVRPCPRSRLRCR